MPSPVCRRSSPHTLHFRGGFFGGTGREQIPHQPVSSRMKPREPHRGHSAFAACRSAFRTHGRHTVASRAFTGPPHSLQRREQRTHRPEAGRTRFCPQPGQDFLAAASRIPCMHRQQYSRPMNPTGAPQPMQSRCFFPIVRPAVRSAASSGRVQQQLSPAGPKSAEVAPAVPAVWCRCRCRTGHSGCIPERCRAR